MIKQYCLACIPLLLLLPSLHAEEKPLEPGEKAGDLWEGNSLGIKFRWCPPGKFTMGSPESEKGHDPGENQVTVTLTRGFWFGQHEVTQAEWESLMGTTPWKGQSDIKEGESYPATYVNWEDAREFCVRFTAKGHQEGWLPKDWKFKLPTEAQWEYACRAGTRTRFSFGDDEAELSDYAWWGGIVGDGNTTDEEYAHQVGHKKANSWGLYDMHGNIYEWCRDWNFDRLPGGIDPDVQEQIDPDVQATWRVVRGGSWNTYHARHCRSAARYIGTPSDQASELGFRLAAVQTR